MIMIILFVSEPCQLRHVIFVILESTCHRFPLLFPIQTHLRLPYHLFLSALLCRQRGVGVLSVIQSHQLSDTDA